MIEEQDKIKCAWCNEHSTALDWNELSKAECTTREMRRKYKDIFNENVFNRNKKPSYYKCPKCSMWSKGSQLRVVETDNEYHKRLGGESVIRSVKQHKEVEHP